MTNAEKSLKTKRALSDALKNAMKTKELSRITVSELIAECSVNRKTFYYHFKNIYDLLKWTLDQEAIEVVKNFDLIVNAEEAICFIMDYTEQNSYIIIGALDSMGYSEIKRFFHKDLFSVIYSVIDSSEANMKVHIAPEFKQFLAEFYTEASAGMIIEWAKKPVNRDKETVIKNISSIFKITIPAVLSAKYEERKT